jgi:succinate dehydrogenase / fumarate reductase flavoprotein subunit
VGQVHKDQIEGIAREALEPFERSMDGPRAENPYAIQHELQRVMQDLVGIARNELEMEEALEEIARLRQRAKHVAVSGNREYNPGWHTALDLRNLLTYSEAIARAGLERKESRGAHARIDFPDKDPQLGKVNIVIRKGRDGELEISQKPIPETPAELRRIIEEMK